MSDSDRRIRARAWLVSQRFFGYFLGLQSGRPTRASAASHFLNRKFSDESQRIISLFESMVSGYNFSVNDLTLRYALGISYLGNFLVGNPWPRDGSVWRT